MNNQYPSSLLENAVNEFAKLPGIGRKTALRHVLHLLRLDDAQVEEFANAIVTLKKEIKYCNSCHNISGIYFFYILPVIGMHPENAPYPFPLTFNRVVNI